MKLLLKQVTISDKNSPFNGSVQDILILNGKIEKIDNHIEDVDAQVLDQQEMIVSAGWVDIFAHFNDPGLEHKETLESGSLAAAAGGYTHVFIVPNTIPTISNKSTVEYIVQKSNSLPVKVLPLGSISKNAEGVELSEMYDMYKSGAIAFTDGTRSLQTPGLLLKALQYVKAIDAVLIQLPADQSIAKFGLINEGVTSTRLGLAGIPAIAEELMVMRDLELAKYTGSKIHITGISTARSLQLIEAAKSQSINVSCSVTPYHLTFCDEDLADYDTNLKTDPPLRSKEDMLALRQGILNGTIDCIATHHLPQIRDHKMCEFEYAATGMIGLETAFAAVNTALPTLPTHRLIDLFSSNARRIFSVKGFTIDAGQIADLTLLKREGNFIYNSSSVKSKSRNSPFLNKQLRGEVVGTVFKGSVYLNETYNHEGK